MLRDYPSADDYSDSYVLPLTTQEPREKTKVFVPLLLLFLAFLSTWLGGLWWYYGFLAADWTRHTRLISWMFAHPLPVLMQGLSYAVAILTILIAHEMGHYLTCRRYGLNATLPYVIPAPPPINPFGTFGAVIRIRSMFEDRRQLFDVGIAGPLMGFLLIIPTLFIGLYFSRMVPQASPGDTVLYFGEPLAFRWAAALVFPGQDTSALNLHPIGWAAWFGMLATSINLLPIGQLDGGHIVYALFGRRGHRIISITTFGGLVALGIYSWPTPSYLIFAVLVFFLGFKHPRPYMDAGALGRKRVILAIFALLMFILTFMPIPVRIIENVGRL